MLDRSGSAKQGKQRGVSVDTSESRQVEHAIRKNSSIGNDNRKVGSDCFQTLDKRRVACAIGLKHFDVVAVGELRDCGSVHSSSAA